MTIALDPLISPRSQAPERLLRVAAIPTLMLAELLAFSICFDGTTLRGLGAWDRALLSILRSSVQLGITVAGIGAMLLGPRLADRFLRPGVRPSWAPVRWPLLAAHLVAFAGFFWPTFWLRDELSIGLASGGLRLAWFALGGFAAATGLAAWWPRGVRLAPGRAMTAGAIGCLMAGAVSCWLGRRTGALWEDLAGSTFAAVELLLRLTGRPVVSDRALFLIGTPRFLVEIAPECSGYEGMGLMLGVLGIALFVLRGRFRFPHAFLLLPAGVAAAWAVNAVRIAALILVGDGLSKEVAADGFHSQAGWLGFNAAAFGLILLATRLPWLSRGEPRDASTASRTPSTAAFLGPLLTIVSVSMMTGAFAVGIDALYPARVIAGGVVLWAFRSRYRDVLGPVSGWWSWWAAGIGLATFAIWMALEPADTAGASSALRSGLERMSPIESTLWLAFRLIGSTIAVPLAEELAFRGYLTRRLIRPDFEAVEPGRFSWPSFLISSLLFGALHQRWLAGTLAGMLYALAATRRGRLADAVVAHAVTNALIGALALGAGRLALWS